MRTTVIVLASAVLLAASSAAVAAPGTSVVPGSGDLAAGASLPGVVAAPGGWVDYTQTLASSLTLQNATTTTFGGTRAADGTCTVAGAGSTTAGSSGSYQEEVAFNPQTCQERVLSGSLSRGDLAQLNAGTGGLSNTVQQATSPGTAAAGVQQAATKAQAAAATSYQQAYSKTAWIDPLNITITSLAVNLKWPLYGAGGTLTARVNPYDFPYDGWSSGGPSPIGFQSVSGGWAVDETDQFTNTDFATLVYAVFGLAGWIACGAPLTATAHFNHNVTVLGYSNGNRGWAWNDSANGACTDLVHHAAWNDYGWTS